MEFHLVNKIIWWPDETSVHISRSSCHDCLTLQLIQMCPIWSQWHDWRSLCSVMDVFVWVEVSSNYKLGANRSANLSHFHHSHFEITKILNASHSVFVTRVVLSYSYLSIEFALSVKDYLQLVEEIILLHHKLSITLDNLTSLFFLMVLTSVTAGKDLFWPNSYARLLS